MTGGTEIPVSRDRWTDLAYEQQVAELLGLPGIGCSAPDPAGKNLVGAQPPDISPVRVGRRDHILAVPLPCSIARSVSREMPARSATWAAVRR
jgi:hypothetical protein